MRLRRILCCKKDNDGFSFPSLGLVQAQNGTSKPVSLPCIFLPIYSFLFSFCNVFYEYKRKFEVIFYWCRPKAIHIWLGIWVSRLNIFSLATMLRAGQSWVRTPGVARHIFFFFLNVPKCSGPHQGFYWMGTGVFCRGKEAGAWI